MSRGLVLSDPPPRLGLLGKLLVSFRIIRCTGDADLHTQLIIGRDRRHLGG